VPDKGPLNGCVCTSVDIGASAKLELVDKFCYLGDMLNVDGDADAAVEARIRIGWNKFRQLVPLLTNKDVSLIMRGRLCSSCVRSSMLHGSETCTLLHTDNHASTPPLSFLHAGCPSCRPANSIKTLKEFDHIHKNLSFRFMLYK